MLNQGSPEWRIDQARQRQLHQRAVLPGTLPSPTAHDQPSPQQLHTEVIATADASGWDTLIPATFGVPMREFEAGWQAYLRTHYANSTP